MWAETFIRKTKEFLMSNVVPLTNTSCPFEKRNFAHHEGFCDFLVGRIDRANQELVTYQAIVDRVDELKAKKIEISRRRHDEYEAAQMSIKDLQDEKRRLRDALCMANEFMNV
jgi:hypothetical protein